MICIIKQKPKRFIFAVMFKQVTATILLMAFSVQTFSSPFIMLDYFVNTAAYAKNCVNKARPKMHCNGQCQVMKKIREQERKDQQDSQRKAENKIPVLSAVSFFCSVKFIPAVLKIKYPPLNTRRTQGIALSVFHPPQV